MFANCPAVFAVLVFCITKNLPASPISVFATYVAVEPVCTVNIPLLSLPPICALPVMTKFVPSNVKLDSP